MKIAIFGGTFDPWTSAHQEIASRLSQKYDKVLVVPTTVTYYKNGDGMFSFDERMKAAAEKTSDLKNVEVLPLEKDKTDSWRFIDTLKEIRKIYGAENEYFTAIGSDSLQKFTTWTLWEDILKLSKLIVFNRPSYTADFPDIEYEYLEMENNASSTELREEMKAKFRGGKNEPQKSV